MPKTVQHKTTREHLKYQFETSGLTDIPPPLEEGEKELLFARLRDGPREAAKVRDQIIFSYIRLALYLSRKLVGRDSNTTRKDCCDAQAMYLLTRAVRALETKDAPDPTGYIVRVIKRQLLNWLKEDTIVRIPSGTKSKVPVKCQSGDVFVDYTDMLKAKYYETLDVCTITPESKRIVELRVQGMSIVDIATEMKKPRQEIVQILKGIYRCVKENG